MIYFNKFDYTKTFIEMKSSINSKYSNANNNLMIRDLFIIRVKNPQIIKIVNERSFTIVLDEHFIQLT